MRLYASSILDAAREALQTHGSIKAFLADTDASADAVRMYVADYLSLRLGIELFLANSEALGTPCGPMRDAHITDGVSTIVRCDMRHELKYSDFAPFLSNAIGYKDGQVASPWKHIIVARKEGGKVCDELAALFKCGPFHCSFTVHAIELYMLSLLQLSEKDGTVAESSTPCTSPH
jgi:hypothetical protein